MNTDDHVSNSEHCMLASGEAHDDERANAAMLNAIGGVQQALLAAVSELKRMNDSRDSFHREVLEVLTQAKGAEPGPCPNRGPSTGTGTYTVAPCRLRAGHKGMHEAEDGMAWTGGVSAGATFSEGPSGAGATAQVAEKEGP